MSSIFPKNRLGRRVLYELLHAWSMLRGISMFNVGCSPVDADIANDPAFKGETFQFQLYAELLKLIVKFVPDPDRASILEVGSGGGGGLRLLRSKLPRAKVSGIDNTLVATLRGKIGGLDVSYAPAERLPYEAGSLDCIACVDSFSIFAQDAFLAEVRRTLRPNGLLLIGDYLQSGIDAIRKEHEVFAAKTGFEVVEFNDLTARVIEALEFDHERKHCLIASFPSFLRIQLEDTLSMPGTERHNMWREGKNAYYLTAWRRSATFDVS